MARTNTFVRAMKRGQKKSTFKSKGKFLKTRSVRPKRQRLSMNQRTGGLLGVELKYYDVSLTSLVSNSSASAAGVLGIACRYYDRCQC